MTENYVNNVNWSTLKNNISVKYFCVILVLSVSVLISSYLNGLIVIISYVCGFLFCYFTLKYKTQAWTIAAFILNYIGYNKPTRDINDVTTSPKISCSVCGGSTCSRHLETINLEPWVGIYIHKQLDQSIEDFYGVILKRFVSEWYSKLMQDDILLVELRFLLRFASSSLLRRGLKVNIAQLITNKLVPCALKHIAICAEAQRLMVSKEYQSLQEAAIDGPLRYSLHPAMGSRQSELDYLRSITKAIMPLLLPKQETDCKLFSILIREIFAGWVLLSLTDVLSDPGIINTLVILATGDEKMSKLPEFPKHQVEFLKNFTEKDSYKKQRLLSLDVSEILKTPEYLYAFMQYMKSVGKVHLLQFCFDIDEFNKKILQPEIHTSDQVALFNSAKEIYLSYFMPESSSFISFASEDVEQLREIISEGVPSVLKLQHSRTLFKSYDLVYAMLDCHWAPKFFNSEDFLKVVCGTRTPVEHAMKVFDKKMDKNGIFKMGSQLTKLKGALKSDTIDGQLLESVDNSIKIGIDSEMTDGPDMDIQFTDLLENYARLGERDLSTWRVSIDNVKEKKISNKTSPLHLFSVNVYKPDSHGLGEDRQWSIDRTDTDFQMLKAKLIEFHGEDEMVDAYIPPKRAKAAVEVRKMKYEVFLQNLLLKPLLRSSDLLHLFLTVDDDFSVLAEQARLGASIVPDIGNIYQNVTHKLRRERGQHLISFLNTFLISTDVDYYQNIKDESNNETDTGEEATDLINDNVSHPSVSENGRCLTDGVFKNNFDLKRKVEFTVSQEKQPSKVAGFSQCLRLALTEVFKVRKAVVGISGTICNLEKTRIDDYFDNFLNDILCKVLSQPRLAHLIKLGQGILFEDEIPPSRKMKPNERVDIARFQLQNCFPFLFIHLMGPNFLKGIDNLFEILQNPLLNKQLIYNLLDIILAELFPELEKST